MLLDKRLNVSPNMIKQTSFNTLNNLSPRSGSHQRTPVNLPSIHSNTTQDRISTLDRHLLNTKLENITVQQYRLNKYHPDGLNNRLRMVHKRSSLGVPTATSNNKNSVKQRRKSEGHKNKKVAAQISEIRLQLKLDKLMDQKKNELKQLVQK